ncbi:uncharacterized protein LOC143154344 isoform X2 [Ptiloglossa arizonensis]|uniref:uncharacterized protein LOC143154344 isoform X2 n=1 Tax=Ptiloglossa arizonensis TaxID=3350558 RepID=UPI003FA19299
MIRISCPTNSKFNELETKLFSQDKEKLCEITRQITGVTFKNIDKNWLEECIYQYRTDLEIADLRIFVELTVKLEGEKEFEIYDIKCHLLEMNKSYVLEIMPWMKNICRMKNFSLLISAFSQYNKENILRTEILNETNFKQYVKYENCTNKNGGILISVHSSKSEQKIYMYINWSLYFLKRTWQIGHMFNMETTDEGFAKENYDLLNNFTKEDLEEESLKDLWKKMICALDQYEKKESEI